MEIRNFLDGDAVAIADVFHRAVHAIPSTLYTREQKEAWSPTPPDYSAWARRLATTQPFVAIARDSIVGFIELGSDGHIDCFYVDPDHQGLGIGKRLLSYTMHEGSKCGLLTFHAEVSKAAEALLRKSGFVHSGKNEVSLRGQTLVNYRMVFGSRDHETAL